MISSGVGDRGDDNNNNDDDDEDGVSGEIIGGNDNANG